MTSIRVVRVENFRGIKTFDWTPREGINCLVGPGDCGKSTVLDAIDFCIGARRFIQFSDADFTDVKVDDPIRIAVAIGGLPDALKNFDAYGLYLLGFNKADGSILPEPQAGHETVLIVQLLVERDLEPQWSLVSPRASAQGQSRSLSWADRLRVSPTRLGAMNENNLAWRKGSILNRLSDERADASKELNEATRDARAAFSAKGNAELMGALNTVTETAKSLGIPIGTTAKAMLDAASISLSGGTIALHNEWGIPLRGLGLGSTRLLLAGLQRKAAANASIILIDEVEHGLEPHRIIMLLGALGAKENLPPLQVFMTTHSPVAVCELNADQLYVLRGNKEKHEALPVGKAGNVQGTIRAFPGALLARSVLVCEGASEVGLIRGFDQWRVASGKMPFTACGCTLVDGNGNEMFQRALAFQKLGYRVAAFRDSDVAPTPELETAFKAAGGPVYRWSDGRALEDELFLGLTSAAVKKLLELAVSLKGEMLVNDHIKTASGNKKDLAAIRAEFSTGLTNDSRTTLGKASCSRKNPWFKSISAMEAVGRDIVAPDLANAKPIFRTLIVNTIFTWIADGTR
jgi:hypothetical protein